MPNGMPDGMPSETPDETLIEPSAERRHLAAEKKNQRYVWWYLAYFLFGIHIVAFVMIYAVTHAK
jgi:hypothetical protein